MSIQIVKCGTKVITVCGEIKGIVTGVSIRDESISYEVSYFSNGVHNQTWMYRYEFEVDVQRKQQAGFNRTEEIPQENNIIYLESSNQE